MTITTKTETVTIERTVTQVICDLCTAELESFADGDAADGPIPRLFALLDAFDAMDDAQLALPGDRANREAILALREAVPVAVNHRVQEA